MQNLIKPAKGTLTFSWSKTIWFYFMLIPVFFIDFGAITWSLVLLTICFTFITVSLGHSIGLHRGIIHKAYNTSKGFRNVLVYLFVLSGLGSPISWLKLHYYRDYWQNCEDCPDYFAYQHSIFRDFWWYLHLSFKTTDNDRYNIPEADLNDPWLIWLHKTWYLHNILLMVLVYVSSDLNTTLFFVFLRSSLTIVGHWYIGYAAHKYGYARFEIQKANESGYNDVVLGLLSFGEGFHNNHHGHPRSAKFSFAWYEIDISWYIVLLFEKAGLIYDVLKPGYDTTLKTTAKKYKKVVWKLPQKD